MLRFHNRVVTVLGTTDFEEVQRTVRWHYQWVVLHDFLPTILGLETWQEIMGAAKPGAPGAVPPPAAPGANFASDVGVTATQMSSG